MKSAQGVVSGEVRPSHLAVAWSIAHRYMETADRNPGYQSDLCMQGLLCLYDATGHWPYLDFVEGTFRHRGLTPRDSLNWQILFTDLHFDMWMRTRDERYLDGWLEQVVEMDQELPRDREGRVAYHLLADRPRLLIDLLQGYALRMARAGALTGDTRYFDKCVEQFERYAALLVNPETGLWHHGRGWDPGSPKAVSPAGWCRGQAWVLRGLVECLICIPEFYRAHELLRHHLVNLATALYRHQGSDGMWRQIVHRPNGGSFPETSGTGMVVYYLARALHYGFVSSPDCRDSLRRAQNALLHYVDDNDGVHNGSHHSPPLPTESDYLELPRLVNDRHAIAAVMMALSVDLNDS